MGTDVQPKIRRLVFVAVAANVLGNFALSRGMRDVGEVVTLSPEPYLRALLNPWVLGGVMLLIWWTVAQLSMLSRADLSYVLPVTAASYVCTSLLGLVFLEETIRPAQWCGIFLISAGVALVGRTAPRTGAD